MAYYTKYSCGIWAATFVPSLQLGVTFVQKTAQRHGQIWYNSLYG